MPATLHHRQSGDDVGTETGTPSPTTQRTTEDEQTSFLPSAAVLQHEQQQPAASWAAMPRKGQLALLALARVVEALAGGSRQSFIIFQLRSFTQADGSAPSTAAIALQLSLLRSVSAVPQLFVSTLWGVLADHPRVGHKRVILACLCISGISSLGMASTRSFAGAVAWQLFGGLSAGNKAVLRSRIRRICGARFESRGVLLLPAAANAGSVLGPLLGGFLAEVPVGGRWPFILPYAMNAVMKLGAAAMIALWLHGPCPGEKRKSTAKKRISLVPKWTERLYRGCVKRQPPYERLPGEEYEMEGGEGHHLAGKDREKQQTVSIWTLQLLLTLAARVLVTMHVFSYPLLLSVFVSTPRYNPTDDKSSSAAEMLARAASAGAGKPSSFAQVPQGYHPHLPFVFTGGLSFKSSHLAAVLATRGIVSCLLQLVWFPRLCKAVGKLSLYRYSLLVFPLTYFFTPYLATIKSSTPPPLPAAGPVLWVLLLSILAIQSTARSMALPAGAMLLNAACPDPSVLSTVNGIGASVAAGARGLGHLIITGWLYGVGLNAGIVGIAWWGMAAIAIMAAIAAVCVPEPPPADIED